MEQMKPRDPAKSKVDGCLLRFLNKLIKENDQYIAFQWESDHYEIMTKNGKLYFVNAKEWVAQ